MAISKKKNKTEAAQKTSPSKAPSQSRLRADDQRQKALAVFDPSVLDWFKDKLNLDVAQMPIAEIWKLGRNELTSPQRLVVTPKAYDAESKTQVDMPPIQVIASIRAVLPSEKGKPVALDSKHTVFLQTVPCTPYVELAKPGEAAEEVSAPARTDDRMPEFTESQKMALEGIGISRERLYDGYNHLSRQEKLDILDGEIFPVMGNVKTDFGFVNVSGEARLTTDADGKASVVFDPYYPEKRVEGMVIDIETARHIGMLELQLFERSGDGKIKVDASGAPILNKAGENILSYGVALEPVEGRTFKRTRDANGVWNTTYDSAMYNVFAVNGSLFAQRLSKKEILGEDGNKVEMDVVPNARMKDGKLFIIGEKEPLKVGSEADRVGLLTGRGGVVQGVTYKDYKSKGNVTYDAFVYINESGFGTKFSPATTEKFLKARKASEARAAKTTTRRKVRFGRGL